MENEVILGETKEGNLLIADYKNVDNVFALWFKFKRPIDKVKVYEKIEDLIEFLDNETKKKLCDDNDKDIARFCEIVMVESGVLTLLCARNRNLENIIFESEGGGQIDVREYGGLGKYFVQRELVEKLFWLWDNYHLKELDDIGLEVYEKNVKILPKKEEQFEVIKNWLYCIYG